MKKKIYYAGLGLMALSMAACKKFDDINKDPYAATSDQVQVEYFINNSIINAQMNPDVAERSFVLYWKTAAHQQEDEGLSSGDYDDGWTTAYYNQTSEWQRDINAAIKVANEQIAVGTNKPYTQNLIEVARIWRAYLMSEMSDVFGPIPINGFQGENPTFSDVKTVYYYLLSELTDASAKLDLAINADAIKKWDPAYGYDFAKWQKFANSQRMRLAMRLSEVDASKAKQEFEAAAATGKFITSADETFKVQEKPGWDALTGVMSREWNPQFISSTLYNLYLGLGGITSAEQLPASFAGYIKPQGYIGQRYLNHFPKNSNNPSIGYWLDGLPYAIDPRAYKTFIIPGDFSNPEFNSYPSWTNQAKTTVRPLIGDNGDTIKLINAAFTYNHSVNGEWGAAGTKNRVSYYYPGTVPRLANEYRNSTSQRIFFAPWETYFLIAEAAVRGWTVPMSGKDAYENGIKASFDYVGVPIGSYLSSTEYNRVGTSVSWDHTTEPPATHSMSYVDGYTGVAGVADIKYPVNNLYKNGTVRNDLLTKIITQKYLAQVPWLPLEAWSDQRRLGLPFFENPAVEKPIPTIPDLNATTVWTSKIEFFPQRIKYPSSLKNNNVPGYQQAVDALGASDDLFSPLWWAQH